MKPQHNKNYQLTSKQRSIIEYELSKGKIAQEIIDSWDIDFHNRLPPTIQTIYKIQRQMKKKESVEPKKKGPKNRSILTPEKLNEIEKVININNNITYEDLGLEVNISYGSACTGIKLLGYDSYDAKVETFLTETQMEKRLTFCNTFLRWNYPFKMRVWWSDESLFSIDNISRYCSKKYFAKENEHKKIPKKIRQKSKRLGSNKRRWKSVVRNY